MKRYTTSSNMQITGLLIGGTSYKVMAGAIKLKRGETIVIEDKERRVKVLDGNGQVGTTYHLVAEDR